jgi:hypothetical protein
MTRVDPKRVKRVYPQIVLTPAESCSGALTIVFMFAPAPNRDAFDPREPFVEQRFERRD